jgi:hypothetical protein
MSAETEYIVVRCRDCSETHPDYLEPIPSPKILFRGESTYSEAEKIAQQHIDSFYEEFKLRHPSPSIEISLFKTQKTIYF